MGQIDPAAWFSRITAGVGVERRVGRAAVL